MKAEFIEKFYDLLGVSKIKGNKFDARKVLGGIGGLLEEAGIVGRKGPERYYEHEGVGYTVFQREGISSPIYQSTIHGITLPAYKEPRLNEYFLEEVVWEMLRPLEISRGKKPPCYFEFGRKGFVPILTHEREVVVRGRSGKVIDCYLNNREGLMEAQKAIRREKLSVEKIRELMKGFFVY